MTVTISQLKDRLKEFAGGKLVARHGKRLQLAASYAVEGSFKKRIFDFGQDSDFGQIGKYSSRPFTAYKEDLQASGIPMSKFKKAKKNKSGREYVFFKGGYKELRETIGREAEKVNLELSGSLKDSLKVGMQGKNVVFGFSNEQLYDIAIENENRFGKDIFTPSTADLRAAVHAVELEIKEILK